MKKEKRKQGNPVIIRIILSPVSCQRSVGNNRNDSQNSLLSPPGEQKVWDNEPYRV